MENSNELTPQQYRKYNGQSVLSALRSIGREATTEELTKYIGKSIGQSEDVIKPEVQQVLRRGIINGFLVRKGKSYSLSGQDNIIEIDAPKKRRRISFDQRNSKKEMSNSNENLPTSQLRLSEAPAPSSSTKTEPKLRSYGRGGSNNIPRHVSESSTDDSEPEYDQNTFLSSGSDEEPEQESFLSFLRQQRH